MTSNQPDSKDRCSNPKCLHRKLECAGLYYSPYGTRCFGAVPTNWKDKTMSKQPDSPVEPEKEKQILKALHEANWKQVQLVYALEIDHLIKAEVVKGRLIELDLLEQAINTGWDMNKYKLYRLKALKQEMKDG